MSWKDEARRTIVSGKKDLESFSGYWVKVKKYSVEEKDKISVLQRDVQKSLDKKTLGALVKAHAKGSADIGCLTDEEAGSLLDMQNIETKKLLEAKIRYGVAEHNFCDAESSNEVQQFAKDVLQYEPIAAEILQYIEDYNRPLAARTSLT